jgi:hypothetical protein
MRNILFAAGLASLPLLSAAQSNSIISRFYVGAGTSLISTKPFQDYSSTYVGPALTAGIQFTPRLALQLSGAYAWRKRSDSFESYYFGTVGTSTFNYEIRNKLFTFPLLLRVTVTEPTKPLRVDMLGGPMLFYGTAHEETQVISQGQEVDSFSNRYSNTSFSLALGPSLRYSLTSRAEIAVNALVNIGLNSYFGNFSNRLTSSILASVNYSFGE